MPLVHFHHRGQARLGKLFGDHLVDLSVAAPQLPTRIRAFLAEGEGAIAAFKAVDDVAAARLPLAEVRLLPPIPDPEKFLGIGMNYRAHADEAAKAGLQRGYRGALAARSRRRLRTALSRSARACTGHRRMNGSWTR